ncbi:MAG: HAD family hydrolase [Acidimicrobiales bacterium]|nr:HAD family hydrolase [Acidimicrobiales bacterium]
MLNLVGKAVIFDKDGTLLDFEATWNEAVGTAFDQIADQSAKIRAAEVFGYDLTSRCVLPHSAFVSETSDTTDDLVADLIDVAAFKQTLNEASRRTVVANRGAGLALESLAERGWKLAIATNDSELLATEHIEALAWAELFTSIMGFDSGHGAKPGPGMVLAAAEACDALDGVYLMVGDSVHDVLAGRAAGAITVAIGDDPAALQLADHTIDQMGDLVDLVESL